MQKTPSDPLTWSCLGAQNNPMIILLQTVSHLNTPFPLAFAIKHVYFEILVTSGCRSHRNPLKSGLQPWYCGIAELRKPERLSF